MPSLLLLLPLPETPPQSGNLDLFKIIEMMPDSNNTMVTTPLTLPTPDPLLDPT